jgi:hypothetical protein
MAIKLNTSYSKKLGLPGFSSHAFSVSVEVELADINQVGTECARLYGLLQASVDGEIRHTGFVPDDGYGLNGSNNGNSNGGSKPHHRIATSGKSGTGGGSKHKHHPASGRQRELIFKVAGENGLNPDDVDALAHELCGTSLDELDKNAASTLIDALFEHHGKHQPAGSR